MGEDKTAGHSQSIAEQLATLRASAEALKLRRSAQADERELEGLELEAKYETELGARGVKWDMVSNALGNFVVKLGDTVAYKRFLAVDEKERSEEDAARLVVPYVVHPDHKMFASIAGQHGGIYWQLALSMLQMYEAKGTKAAGK
jgi:hypothetical protein